MNQQPPWLAQQQSSYSPKMPLPRTNVQILVKIALCFIGAFIAWVGFLGGIITGFGANAIFEFFAFSFSLLALIGSIIIFFRNKYYIHCLPGLQYLWWTLGVTAASFIVLIIAFGTVTSISKLNNNQLSNALVGSGLLLYGISLMWIAHRKPPIAQQVNESVYRILKTMPGNQIVISDLLARLQREYKQLGAILHQYVGNLEYIEQIGIPGAPGIVCRMKQLKTPATESPIQSVPVSTPYLQIAPVAKPYPTPVPQTPPPPVAQTNLPQSARPNDAFRPLADQKTVTSLPVPNQMTPAQPIQNTLRPRLKPAELLLLPAKQPVTPPPPIPDPPKPTPPVNQEPKAIQIFCCYAYKDESRLKRLKAHLAPQQRQGFVHIWYDRDISAGTEWEQEIAEQLNAAQIILLLVSADFIASDYCYSEEMKRALERHARREVRVIPIILRSTDWRITPLGKLQALPKNGKPITSWSNHDDAYLDVAQEIRAVVEGLLALPQQPKREAKPPTSSGNQRQRLS